MTRRQEWLLGRQARQGEAGGTSSSFDLPTGVACHTSTTTNPPQPAPLAPQINTFVATEKESPLAPEMSAFFVPEKGFCRSFTLLVQVTPTLIHERDESFFAG